MNLEETDSPSYISRRRWWIHLILIGGYFTAAIPFALSQAPRRPALLSSAQGLLIVCAIEIALFSVVYGLGWLASRASSEELFLKWRPGWWTVPLGIGYSVVLRLMIAVIFVVIVAILLTTGLLNRESISVFTSDSRTGMEKLVDLSAIQHSRAYFWLTVTLASFVVAGLREELWRAGTLAALRNLWPDMFGDREGQIAAIALIAIIFGLGHLRLGLLAAAMAGILGFFFGIIIVIHRSIWPAVIAHGMFDATSFALLPSVLEHARHIQ